MGIQGKRMGKASYKVQAHEAVGAAFYERSVENLSIRFYHDA